MLPFFKKVILPCLEKGKSALIAAHGNSIRALIKDLQNISDDKISDLEVKTGDPLVFRLENKSWIFEEI